MVRRNSESDDEYIVTRSTYKGLFDINHPGWILIFWDILFGIPFSLFCAQINKYIFEWNGYENFMHSPGGIFLNRMLLIGINMLLVIAWVIRLIEEQSAKRIQDIQEQIQHYDMVIARLERMVDISKQHSIGESIKDEDEDEGEEEQEKEKEEEDDEEFRLVQELFTRRSNSPPPRGFAFSSNRSNSPTIDKFSLKDRQRRSTAPGPQTPSPKISPKRDAEALGSRESWKLDHGF